MIAVQLIAHGSRRAEANEELAEIARRLRDQSDYQLVIASYLELTDPSIPAGVRLCVASGAREVLMLPYFLSSGLHVTEDLQRFRDAAHTEFPDVTFRLCPPLGLHPLIIDILRDRLTEAI
ncbi:MAG: CbiX/SirB N-terminal domain-containing protein [Planctomycetaceae bacterium]